MDTRASITGLACFHCPLSLPEGDVLSLHSRLLKVYPALIINTGFTIM